MNYNHFQNYAIKYYLRFYPSKTKLEEKLISKFKISSKTSQEIIKFLEKNGIIVEEKVIEEKIKYLISKGKNLNYIKNNLIKKQFDRSILSAKLNKISENKSLLEENFIINKILEYKEKNKSKNYIRQKLIERREDSVIVNRLIEENYSQKEEVENLEKNYFILVKMKKDKQQIIRNLSGKGFLLGDILYTLK